MISILMPLLIISMLAQSLHTDVYIATKIECVLVKV